MFPIKNVLKDGDALTTPLFSFASQYPIIKVQIHQNGLKWNDMHQFLVYADDVNKNGRKRISYKEKHRFFSSCW